MSDATRAGSVLAAEEIPSRVRSPKPAPGLGSNPERVSIRRKPVPSSYQVRQQEQHEQKLKDIRDQVATGKLVIRQMTPDERRRFPPRDPAAPSGRAKRR
jgi:hypothetical protein